MKILILSSYYNRPKMVVKMLKSILDANKYHEDWQLGILDDNSPIPLQPILNEVMKDFLDRIEIDNTNMSFEDKVQKGLQIGKYANRTIAKSDADLGILLCDDDRLHPTYLKKLSDFFEANADVKYCYSKIALFNPLIGDENDFCFDNKYNCWKGPINPVGKVDASQVAWRLSCCQNDGAWFAESTKIEESPLLIDTDKSFFENLYEKCGPAMESGLVSQYKGIHDYQLVWHKKTGAAGLRKYFSEIEDLDIL